ncbi:MAG: hypothetical protein GY730_10540 [bacterium]|nr:hypothetical protein [bacterium]
MYKKFLYLLIINIFILSSLSFAGGWDKSKGLDKITVEGKLVCIGCSLKKLSGANAQCSLYSQHDTGLQLKDGSIWSIVNNQKGHDIIRAHHTVINKTARITGWLYPNARHIEIDSISVKGVSKKQIARAALKEDRLTGRALLEREEGAPPVIKHKGHKH